MMESHPTATPDSSGPGRRERKKAATRASISSAALSLFIERGFAAVSIRDIADKADVAVATIFAHFSGKEALVFDEDPDIERSLLAAVTQRPPHTSPLAALEEWFLAGRAAVASQHSNPEFDEFRQLVKNTPALHDYWRSMWRRYEPALSDSLASSSDLDESVAEVLSALVIGGYLRAADAERPDLAITVLFKILRNGLR